MCKLLLRLGASIGPEKNGYMVGEYPLMRMVSTGNDIDVLNELVDHGADPLAETATKQTAMFKAIMYNRPEHIRWLSTLERTHSAEYMNDNGYLHTAACQRIETLREVLNFGLDVNLVRSDDKSPLWVALISDNSADKAALLLDRGAIIDTKCVPILKNVRPENKALMKSLCNYNKRRLVDQCLGMAQLDFPVLVMIEIFRAGLDIDEISAWPKEVDAWKMAKIVKRAGMAETGSLTSN